MSQNSPNMNFDNEPTEPFMSPWQQAAGQMNVQPPTQQTAKLPPMAPAKKPRKLSRRALLGGTAAGLVVLGGGGFALGDWIQHNGPYTLFHGPLAGSQQVGHLLRHAGFGASPTDIATYSQLSYQDAVDRLLNYQQVSDTQTDNRLSALNLNMNTPVDQQRWWLLKMAWTQRPLLEKMTLFWHGVLTSAFTKVGGKNFFQRMIIQNQFLRSHAFDTFDNIMLGITSDPAMLFYLDLTKSRKNAPNENYAREMMELFTIGLGHYTQQDVFESAAALTGWHVRGLASVYLSADHNDLTKTYLGHTGNLDYKDVVNILVNHPAAPWFICRKLFTFFAYENPSTEDLQPLVDTYVQSGHNMGAVMRTLLLSPQFTSSKAYRSRIKSPAEFAVGVYRALGLQGSGKNLPLFTTLMGQTLFNPPNVAGWPGDKVSALWINSGTWMTRLNYIDALLVRGDGAAGEPASPYDLQGIVNSNNIDSPEHFVDYFAAFLHDGNLDPARRQQLIDYFTTPDSATFGQQIALKNGQSYPLNRVRGTLYLLLATPEYQLS